MRLSICTSLLLIARLKVRAKRHFKRAAGRGVRDEALVGEGEDDAVAAGGITGIADACAVCRDERGEHGHPPRGDGGRPRGWRAEVFERACGDGEHGIFPAQEQAQGFAFERAVEAAHDGVAAVAVGLQRFHCGEDGGGGAGAGAEEGNARTRGEDRGGAEESELRGRIEAEAGGEFAGPLRISRGEAVERGGGHRRSFGIVIAASDAEPIFDVVVEDEIEFLVGEAVVFGERAIDFVEDGFRDARAKLLVFDSAGQRV